MKIVRYSILALAISGAGPAMADCTDKVQDAFAKLRAEKSFRQDTKITDPTRGSLSMSTDFVLPDRMHQKVSAGEDSGAVMETIVVGKKVFSNGGQGWAEVPEKFAQAIVKQLKTIAAPSKSELTYKCGGDKDLDGNTFVTFQAELPAAEAIPGKAAELSNTSRVQTLYVDKSTGVPVHNIVADANAPDKILFDGKFTLVDGLKIKEPDVKK